MHWSEHKEGFPQEHRSFPVGRVLLSLSVLLVNAFVTEPGIIAGLLLTGCLLCALNRLSSLRLRIALVGSLYFVLGAVFAFWLWQDKTLALRLALKPAVGLWWTAWLSETVSWSDLREHLMGFPFFRSFVTTLDQALAQSSQLLREIHRVRTASLARAGVARPSLEVAASVLGAGLARGVERGLLLSRLQAVHAVGIGSSFASSSLPSGDPILELREASFGPKELSTPLLEKISFRLGYREVVCVAGRSGGGKTTLLQGLSGFVPLREGIAERWGEPLPLRSAKAQPHPRIGVVFQNPDDQFFGTTARSDIQWGLVQRGVSTPEATEKTERCLRQLGLSALADRPFHCLSFGEKKRVAVASAVVLEPSLLLFDEPTAGLDPTSALELLAFVESALRGTNAAILWATHELDRLPGRCDRVLYLSERRIAFDGTPKTFWSDEHGKQWRVAENQLREGGRL